MKKQWKTSDDLLEEIQTLFDELRSGTVDVENARVLGNLLKQGVKVVEIEVSHARMTGRLKDGSKAVPGFRRGD